MNRWRSSLLLSVLAAATSCGDGGGSDPDAAAGADSGGSLADASGGTSDAAGCGMAGAPTGVTTGTIPIRGVDRSYVLAVPIGYDPARRHALVWAWHGRGSYGSQARAYFGVEAAAAGAAIVVYPDGLPQSTLANDTGWDLTETGVDVELFDALGARLAATYCIDPGRVFSTGHSFGGYMSNSLGCYRSAALAAIAPVAGGGPFGPCDGGKMPAWIAHGRNDSVVPISVGEASRERWRQAAGCDATSTPTAPEPCQVFDGCGDTPVVWCEHDDTVFGGHGWPAFAAAGIWGFFAAVAGS